MKLTKRPRWEELICSFMVAAGIPGFRYHKAKRRFFGVKGMAFVRIMPHSEGGWAKLPGHFKRYEIERNQGSPNPVVMIATSSHYGPNIEDSFVITRLETFARMLADLVQDRPDRYLGKE